MPCSIRARVKAGVLEPLEVSDLPEGKGVWVSIEELPDRTAAEEAFARARRGLAMSG